ncbi:MAG: cobyrinate a,c-diamide synthase [Deltaproteobacteria bacterium]|uniref:cobyrinate a,c-diamide synthase n=1 Tax=Hydrosulfovibrio ferrireducens TaxID=2934181 RepID=UPI000CAA9A70|nr:MAG: cobyrinate a,c-diamide synthase [Deltaproteobacteria bacterium HGW-Deltaproteobacteria-16]TDB30867.1 MAG: cobyrinate a,c-diamide synthase [Deltaproteobacteria bacterium]
MAGDRDSAILIAGTSSGSGKTTITLGLLAALRNMGMPVQPFKCGPDFIDPGLHQLACGRVSRNLDLWMMGEAQVRGTFAKGQKSPLPLGGLGRGGTSDEPGSSRFHPSSSPFPSREGESLLISVIEGVMGMFDGQDSSSAALAKVLGVPVVLILDVRSAAESVAAVLKGFETLMPEVAPVAVILNRVASPRHLELVSGAIRKHCRAEILGHLPQSLDFSMPARHLGLFTGVEQPISPEALESLAATIRAQVNLERLLELAASAIVPAVEDAPPRHEQGTVQARIGVARDRAFCFYYEDNFDLLRAAGAELVFFSPLADRDLPEGLDGLYLGGGYPELYARELSGNLTMRQAISDWADSGRVLYAECGGFMYLTEGIVGEDIGVLPMAGVFPVTARMQKKRASLGYREVRLEQDCFFGPTGTVLRGHEFHYSVIDQMPDHVERIYTVNSGNGEQSREGYRYNNVLGGYLHLHFGYNPQMAVEFVRACRSAGPMGEKQ